jgi:hypothetical protein
MLYHGQAPANGQLSNKLKIVQQWVIDGKCPFFSNYCVCGQSFMQYVWVTICADEVKHVEDLDESKGTHLEASL